MKKFNQIRVTKCFLFTGVCQLESMNRQQIFMLTNTRISFLRVNENFHTKKQMPYVMATLLYLATILESYCVVAIPLLF